MQTWRHQIILVLLCLVFFVPGIASVPPMDRDEARYVQATNQMIQSGDLIDIRFQDTTRYKKPIGIYWMQTATVTLAAGGDTAAVWAYRLPSIIGGIAAVLLTYLTAALFISRTGALLSGGFMAGSVMLIAEAHQAKTDAMLLAATMGAMYVIARLFAAATPELWPRLSDSRVSKGLIIAFWMSLAISVLVKGPVGLMVVALLAISVSLLSRSAGWLRPLASWQGAILFLLIVVPWFVAVAIKSGGAFFAESVGHDLVGKIAGGQESHGAWPGYYILLFAVTFWPASLFVWPGVFGAFRIRHTALIRFLACWVLPAWIIFELVPTKLPHYTLPVYPALAILAAAVVTEHAGLLTAPLRGSAAKGWSILWGAVGIALAVAALVLPTQYGDGFSVWTLPTALLAIVAGAGPVALLWRDRLIPAAGLAILAGGLTGASVFAFVLPELTRFNLSDNLRAAITEIDEKRERPVFVSGYGEPSMIFLVGTETKTGSVNDAATFLGENPAGIVAVDIRGESQFLQAADMNRLVLETRGRVTGFNYSKGRDIDLGLYTLKSAGNP